MHTLVRRGMAHVREGRRIFADLTVHDNLVAASFALTGRKDAHPDFDDIYDLFPRLKERRTQLAGYLSGGEQQMLALGRALIGKPEIVLLDEPSLGLAPKLVLEIFDTISRINEERGATILLVEQNANVAFSHAHYGYILENGRVVIGGEVEKLRAEKDCLKLFREKVVGAALLSDEELDTIFEEERQRIENTTLASQAAPRATKADLMTDVYSSY